ncbi:MAG: DUF1835 domain-containing protein [Polyangiaceae bacterium]
MDGCCEEALVSGASAGGFDRLAMRLHLSLGDNESLRERFPADRVARCRDAFTEGPCRFEAPLEPAPWLRRRRAWWLRSTGDAADPAELAELEAADEALARDLARCADFDEVLIWTTDDVREQLFACWVASSLSMPRPPVLHARPVVARATFSALPLSSPETLRAVTPRPVAAAELDAAAELWRAYVSESPADFARLALAGSVGPLADQVGHVLPRFPARIDGLTVWERRLLTRIRDHAGEGTARTVGHVLRDGMDETPDHIGDGTLFDHLLELGASGLLEVDGDGKAMRSTRFAITALGRDVLGGSANRVAEVGFERWIGGTHLDATRGGPFWWFHEGSLEPGPVPEPRG